MFKKSIEKAWKFLHNILIKVGLKQNESGDTIEFVDEIKSTDCGDQNPRDKAGLSASLAPVSLAPVSVVQVKVAPMSSASVSNVSSSPIKFAVRVIDARGLLAIKKFLRQVTSN